MNKIILGSVALLVALVSTTLIYFRHEKAISEPSHRVKMGSLKGEARGTGKVESVTRPADLSFPVSGIVKTVRVEEGQLVQQGDILAELDASELDVEVARAEGGLKEAQARLKKVKQPARVQEIQQADERLKQAQSEIKSAELRLKALESPVAPAPAPKWQIEAADQEVAQAHHARLEAYFAYKQVMAKPSADEVAVAESKWREAQYDLTAAEEYYKLLQDEGFPHAIRGTLVKADRAKYAQEIERARRREATAHAEYDRVKKGPSDDEKNRSCARANELEAVEKIAALKKEQLANPQPPSPASKQDIEAAKLAVEKAQSGEREARAALDLLKADPIPADLEAAEAAVAQAEKALSLAKVRRVAAELKAPFDGVVVGRYVEPGGTTPPHTPVLSIADVKHLRVRAEIASRWSPDLKPGLKVSLQAPEVLSRPLPGTVTQVMPLLGPKKVFSEDPRETKGGEVALVLIDFDKPENEEHKAAIDSLRSGLRMEVLIGFETRQNVLIVPLSFVKTVNNEQVIYRQGEDTPVPVTLGDNDGIYVEVLQGLSEGDWIVRPATVRP
ncbi:MAG: HlyD family efflux transporter periplasmic adaptor subunit [Planctomycetes bacterium]|nr:HlyD family efflux transporter periplasmic adaptor subunit [Planctomycetota bacterium]